MNLKFDVNFEVWVQWLIDEIEGHKYTDRENDRGGKTKFGITAGFYSDFFKEKENWIHDEMLDMPNHVYELSYDQAKFIYRLAFWEKYKAANLPVAVAWCLLDSCINHGNKNGVRLVQSALGVVRDGIIGPITQRAMFSVDDEFSFWRKFRAVRTKFYTDIIKDDITQLDNIGGWTNRMHVLGEGILINYFDRVKV